jgi:hypothetical protein
MPTTQDETRAGKPAKPRSRSRKTTEQRKEKGSPKPQTLPDQVLADAVVVDAAPVSAVMAPVEAVVIETSPVEIEAAPVEIAPAATRAAESMVAMEKTPETVLSGEVLPPEVTDPVREMTGLPAIALAYGDYTRTSWANGRFLGERLTAARSLSEVIEIHGEFARQAYANFVTQSQRISVLYGEWAQQFFAPLEKFSTGWTRIGR